MISASMIDRIDRKILTVLTNDGRASVESVAGAVGLSPTPTRRRIRHLEEAGVIRAVRADIDPEKCGLELAVYVFIKLQSRDRGHHRGIRGADHGTRRDPALRSHNRRA